MSRPRTNPEKHKKNVAITLDPVLLRNSRALAASRGTSLSQLLDDLLREWMRGQSASDAQLNEAIANYIEIHETRQEAKARKIQPAGGEATS